MRNFLFLLLGSLIFSACSSPRYTYHFDHYDYNSGRKPSQKMATAEGGSSPATSPVSLEKETLIASTTPVPETKTIPQEKAASIFEKKYRSMSKDERKVFRQEFKKEVKAYMKATKEGDHVAAASATNVMDNDLRLAIIFGAVGLTLSLFGGVSEAFWILGVIAIVVGVVFLIKWLVRQ